MADRRIDELSALASPPASGDLFVVQDVSDTSDQAQGTYKKMTAANVHGDLATDAELASHEADTTNVHGITDTSTLVTTSRTASESQTGIVELATSAETVTGTDTARAVTPAGGAAAFVAKATAPWSFTFVLSDETTALTTGTKLVFRFPFAATVTAVRAALTTASSSGTPTVDIKEGGVSILSTKITIDANEKTSESAVTPPVISDASIADDGEVSFVVDVAGTGATGLKVTMRGTRAV